MAQFPWLEKFPVDASTYSDSLTAIKEFIATGLISEEEYLTWASLHYRLPKVSTDFFTKKLNTQLAKKYKYDDWNEAYYPIHEWNGVLYVACLEPREDKVLNLNIKLCHVLAPLETMTQHWPAINPLDQTATKTSAQIVTPVEEAQSQDVTSESTADEAGPTEDTLKAIESPQAELPSIEINSSAEQSITTAGIDLGTDSSIPIAETETPSLDVDAEDIPAPEAKSATPSLEINNEELPEVKEKSSTPALDLNNDQDVPVANQKSATPSLDLNDSFSAVDEAGAFDLDFSSLKTTESEEQHPEPEETLAPVVSANADTTAEIEALAPPESASIQTQAPLVQQQPPTMAQTSQEPTLETPAANPKPEKTAEAPAPRITEEKTPTSSGVSINPNFNKENYDIPEITQVVNVPGKETSAKKTASNESDHPSFTTTKTIMPFPDRTTQFTFMRTVYSQQLILEAPQQVKDSKDPHEALMSAFRVLKDYFNRLMWVVRDNKGRVYPIACDSNWEFTEEAWMTPLDFKTHNPFRLAKFTQQPFHGPVPKNPSSDAYFKLWYNDEYPDHMTVVPVKLHGKVFGYFIGCGKGQHFHPKHSLDIIQSVCNDLVNTFINMHKELDNAA